MSKWSVNSSPAEENLLPETTAANYDYDRRNVDQLIHDLELKDPSLLASVDRFMVLAKQFLKAPITVFSVLENNSFSVLASRGLSKTSSEKKPNITVEVAKLRSPLVVKNLQGHETYSEMGLFTETSPVAYMGFPIHSPNGFLIGVFAVADREQREWNEEEVSLMRELSQMVEREISHRYRSLDAEHRLAETNNRLEKVLATADCLVWEAEVTLKGDDWNWKFNIQPSGLFKRIFNELIPPENVGLWYRFNIPQQEEMNKRCKQAILAEKPFYHQEFEAYTDSGIYWIKEHVSIQKIEKNKYWLVGVATDITASKMMEKKLSRARDKAIESDRLKSEFLANVSHEIRTPMNGIIGMASILSQEIEQPEHQQMNNLILSSAESLLRVIDDVLDFSKIESNRIEIRDEAFNLKTIVDEVTELLSTAARNKGLPLRCHVDKTLPDLLVGDPIRIRQVMVNLLGNAIKFTESGSVEFNLTFSELSSQRAAIRLDVIDTGPGIHYKSQHHIFHPFVQEDGSLTRRYEGAGLGLAISKKLTDLMGGELAFESTPGKGSHFWMELILPICESQQLADTVATETESFDDKVSVEINNLSKPIIENSQPKLMHTKVLEQKAQKHLLIVDDNPTNRLVCELMLKQLGIKVSAATNGQEALDELSLNAFDAVIMDCQMPVMDGYEATRNIRNASVDGLNPEIPVIALTAHAMLGDKERCLESGMNDYLSKPIRKEDIQNALIRNGVIED